MEESARPGTRQSSQVLRYTLTVRYRSDMWPECGGVIVVVVVVVLDTGSPQISYTAEDDLELLISLPPPPEC